MQRIVLIRFKRTVTVVFFKPRGLTAS